MAALRKASSLLALAASCLSLSGCSEGSAIKADDAAPEILADFDPVFVQAFVSTCIRDFRNPKRVEAFAEEMGWKPIVDPEMRKLIGPDNGNADWKGWAFEHEKKRFMLVLTNSTEVGKPEKICTLIGDPEDLEPTVQHLVGLVDAEQFFDEADAGQTTRMYEFEREGDKLILSFLDAKEMKMPTLNASVLSKPKEN